MNIEAALGYLGAMIDGEGSITHTPKTRVVVVDNSDPDIIEAVIEAAILIGLTYKITTKVPKNPNHREMYRVSFYGPDNMNMIISRVHIMSSIKKLKLRKMIDSFERPQYQRHEVDLNQLKNLLDKGLTHREIASELGLKSHSNVQYYIGRYLR